MKYFTPLAFLLAASFVQAQEQAPAAAPAATAQTDLQAIKLSVPVDNNTQLRAQALKSEILSGAALDLYTTSDGRAWLYLAATETNPKVVAEALEHLSHTFRTRPHQSIPTIDSDYVNVVLARMKSSNPHVAQGAIRASRLLLSKQTNMPETLGKLLELATQPNSTAVRIAALQMLYNIRAFQVAEPQPGDDKARIVDAHIAALMINDPASSLVALENLHRTAYPNMPKQAELLTLLQKLEADPIPAIAAKATFTHAQLMTPQSKDYEAFAKTVEQRMNEATLPYAKAIYAESLAKLGYMAAIPSIAKLLDLSERTDFTWDSIPDYTYRGGILRFTSKSGHRLDETALFALQTLSAAQSGGFTYRNINGKNANAKRQTAINDAKAWLKTLPATPAAEAKPEVKPEIKPEAKPAPKVEPKKPTKK